MDSAELWQLAALLARHNPETYFLGYNINQLGEYIRIKDIAQASVSAGRLRCLSYCGNPDQNRVLMSEFLRWAQSKGLPIPPELKPPAATGPAATAAADASRIEGVKEFMTFCEVRGLKFGSERAAREFIKKAGITPIDGHSKKGRRVWDAAAVEPRVIAESERRKKGTK